MVYAVKMSHTAAQLDDSATFDTAREAWHALALDVAISDDGMPDGAREALTARLDALDAPGVIDAGPGWGTFEVIDGPAPQVTTWADGYGRWHAAVPLDLSGVPLAAALDGTTGARRMLAGTARRARAAIRAELDARGVSPAYRLHVTREHITAAGVAHYGEVYR